MKSLINLRALVVLVCYFALAAAANALRPLSVVVDYPAWLECQLQVFYVGDTSQFYSQNVMGRPGVNFSSLQNRPFFVRVYRYPNTTYGLSGRWDQSRGLVFANPASQGVVWVCPGTDFLTPRLQNLAYW